MTRLDLDDLLDKKQKIYVRNNALSTSLFLVIELQDKSGRNRPFKVPPTTVPLCVSSQFSSDSIRESADLRKMLLKGTLKLVDPVTAEKELATEDAVETLANYQLSVYSDDAAGNVTRDAMQRLKQDVQEPAVNDAMKKSQSQDEKVSLRVRGLVASFLSKEKTSKDVMTDLKRLKTVLTEHDFTFVISQCKEDSKIREFSEKALLDLQNMPQNPFEG